MDRALFGIALWVYLALFAAAFLASMVDSIAGGGGLITVLFLLAAGLSPAEALATNKLQGCMGTLSSSCYFIKTQKLDLQTCGYLL